MFLAKDGDFDLLEVINRCMSAIPLCSYYLRLWTKQEFTYAKTVSVRYASVSKTQCFRQLGSAWMLRYSRPCYSHSDYMSAFARHYYELASSEAAVFGKQADDVAWSQLKVLIDDIRSALSDAVHLYHMVGQTEEHDLYLSQHTHLYVAKFLLGQRLERQAYNGEGEFIHFGSYNSGHRATVENDYALAVFPSHKSYNIPPNREGMTLPELIDDGLSQLESHHFCRYKSFLPKGLFTFQPGSATCKPSLWLGSEPIHSARDIYGPLTSSTFSRVTNMGSIAIKIRGPNEFRAARMTRSSTYGTAFAGKSHK